jgi:hypothetical protein
MSAKPKQAVRRRCQLMASELRYLDEKGDENLLFLRKRGWANQRFEALFFLNSFYQELLGPLHASARTGPIGLGAEFPIKHGSQVFDQAHTRRVLDATSAFFELFDEIGFLRVWASKNTCSDLVYYVAKHERELQSNH